MLLRIARVSSVLLALGVGGWLVLRAQQSSAGSGPPSNFTPEPSVPEVPAQEAPPSFELDGFIFELLPAAAEGLDGSHGGQGLTDVPYLYSSKNPNLAVQAARPREAPSDVAPTPEQGPPFLFSTKLGTVQVPIDGVPRDWMPVGPPAPVGSPNDAWITDRFLQTSKSLRIGDLAPKAEADERVPPAQSGQP
ncbi:MAG: hypothetical protein AAFZ65_07695 [Planctomycetota bacterium]